jgi:cellulose synthase/poly-beta-1,6-N-acetylglucosamine synthase-like glycosyltransferase
LTEDLDLSYRAQLAGWRGRYLDKVVCPGELPDNLLAFKQQQARWARGGAQCVRKLAPQIAHSNLSLIRKIAAIIHITGYFSTLPVLMLALVTPLLILGLGNIQPMPVWLSALGILPIMELMAAQWAQKRTLQAMRYAPVAVILGIGLALSESIAVITGLFGRSAGEFWRTPKSATRLVALPRSRKGKQRTAKNSSLQTYLLHPDWTLRVELGLGVYTAFVALLLLIQNAWLTMLPVLFYAVSFIGVSAGQIIPMIVMQLSARQQSRRVESQVPMTK